MTKFEKKVKLTINGITLHLIVHYIGNNLKVVKFQFNKSNWNGYLSNFNHFGGVFVKSKFCNTGPFKTNIKSVEQLFQREKLFYWLCGTEEQILDYENLFLVAIDDSITKNLKLMKKYGSKTYQKKFYKDVGFETDRWNNNRELLMKEFLLLRLKEDELFYELLKYCKTQNYKLVHTSWRDKHWGCSYTVKDGEWFQNGKNILGELLMELYDEIK